MSHGHAGLIKVTTTLLHDHERVTTPVQKWRVVKRGHLWKWKPQKCGPWPKARHRCGGSSQREQERAPASQSVESEDSPRTNMLPG
jgi:hypothetical protein